MTVAEPLTRTSTVVGRPWCERGHPLFLLGPPRSFTSVIGAMVGRHPQLYGMPELQLWSAQTVADWWGRCRAESFPMADGLLRAVAELVYGEQTELAIIEAYGWLRRRNQWTTGLLFEDLMELVRPALVVDKSPSTVYEMEWMRRAHSFFPSARFVHIARHPRGYAMSVLKLLETSGAPAAPAWLRRLALFPADSTPSAWAHPPTGVDPQHGWYALHSKILAFCTELAPEQVYFLRGEDLLSDPDHHLARLAAWLGLRADDETIEMMKNPELSPYACLGPNNARFGNDPNFLQDATLRPGRARSQSLQGLLPWRGDDLSWTPAVYNLAINFGYE